MSEQTEDEFAADMKLARKLAYVERLQAEAGYLGWQAKREELAYRQEQLEHNWHLDGVYTFHNGVDAASVDDLLRALSIWHRHDEAGDWTIILNSTGGSEYAGYLLIDELRAHSIRGGGTHNVTIKVRGVAASMGGMILQAADHRVIGAYSMLMIHKGGFTFHADDSISVDQLVDEAEWQRQSVDRMVDLFLERADGLTRAQMRRKISRRDWWITAAEAVAFGLADVIG